MNPYSDEQLLEILRQVARETGVTPGKRLLDRTVGWRLSQTVIHRYGTYRRACEAAGLIANVRRGGGERRFSDEDVSRAYRRIKRTLGHEPTVAEWRRERSTLEPSEAILRKRFGSWTAFIEGMGGRPRPYHVKPQLELRRGVEMVRREKNHLLR